MTCSILEFIRVEVLKQFELKYTSKTLGTRPLPPSRGLRSACAHCIYLMKSVQIPDSFPSEGSLFQQSHFVYYKIIIYWAQMKIRTYTIQAIEREMIFNQCKDKRAYIQVSEFPAQSMRSMRTGSSAGQARGFYFRAGQLLLELLCSARLPNDPNGSWFLLRW